MNQLQPAVESFFVGGHYEDCGDSQTMVGQCYVKHYIPAERRAPKPIILVHGGGSTMLDYERTPDGRPGWADYFAAQGFDVYLIDQVGRGRSPSASALGVGTPRQTLEIERHITRPEHYDTYYSAKRHSQWPGPGTPGDPWFDQNFASMATQRFSEEDRAVAMELSVAAMGDLLDRVGPAVVLTHSQSGELGWQVADKFPERVAAIVAVEPTGPPFFNYAHAPAPDYQVDGKFVRPWGVSRYPLSYEPPVLDPKTDLPFYREDKADAEGLMRANLQEGTPRQLVNVKKVTVLVVTGEASYHTAYDHCTVKYLRQAGVDVTHRRLEDFGIHGNGHGLMREKNNFEIAAVMQDWLKDQGLAPEVPCRPSPTAKPTGPT